MGQDITKKCKACEIKFDKINKKQRNEGFKFPKDIPVSETMRKTVNILRGAK